MFWTEESIAFLRDAAAINRYYETIAERIAPQLPENAHICDAGCGIGELSLALKPYCHHVTAVDADELAIKTLKAHLIEGVTARCGDMETLAPEKPYDAMVFCLFGKMPEILPMAKRCCAGRIVVIKKAFTHHRFSMSRVPLRDEVTDRAADFLRERGVRFSLETREFEMGQPLRSLRDAVRFFEIYSKDAPGTLTREAVRARLTETGDAQFPYYLPQKKALGRFTIDTKDIPEEIL